MKKRKKKKIKIYKSLSDNKKNKNITVKIFLVKC